MSVLDDRLTALIEPAAAALGFRLVRVRYGSGNYPVLQIMAERPDGSFSIDDCEGLSRDVSALLDVEDPISGEYNLEVSSPGIDRPLVRAEDYERYAGFETKLSVRQLIDGRRRFAGIVKGIDEDEVITITCDGEDFAIPFHAVEKAKLLLSDELIAAHQEMFGQPDDDFDELEPEDEQA